MIIQRINNTKVRKSTLFQKKKKNFLRILIFLFLINELVIFCYSNWAWASFRMRHFYLEQTKKQTNKQTKKQTKKKKNDKYTDRH